MIRKVSASFRPTPIGAHRPVISRAGIDYSHRRTAFGPENWTLGLVNPHIEVEAGANRLDVRIELPGLRPEDVHVRLDGRLLSISGERWPVDTPDNDVSHERRLPYEVRFGQFQRTIHLPFEADEDTVRTFFEDGALEIVLHRPQD